MRIVLDSYWRSYNLEFKLQAITRHISLTCNQLSDLDYPISLVQFRFGNDEEHLALSTRWLQNGSARAGSGNGTAYSRFVGDCDTSFDRERLEADCVCPAWLTRVWKVDFGAAAAKEVQGTRHGRWNLLSGSLVFTWWS